MSCSFWLFQLLPGLWLHPNLAFIFTWPAPPLSLQLLPFYKNASHIG